VFSYAEEALQKMPYCPECGGEMQYISMTKRYACKSCGLSVTNQELIELRDQLRPRAESTSEERKKAHKEYLKWWLGKKK
jgi:tRNA(Ile2) C34 agmatinyltransferase TiaS